MIMNNLAAVVAPVVIPYMGCGGIDISSLPTWGLVVLIVVVLLLIALLGIVLYGYNKMEFGEESLGIEFRLITIIIDILSVIIGFGGSIALIYWSIEEIINRSIT